MAIIVHHLNFSRSSRLVWLLEALKLDYDIKVYKRDERFLAPKELADLTPTGKSPALEIDGKLYTESGFIFQLLLERYNKVFNYSPEQWDKIHFYLHFTEGSLQPPFTMLYMGHRGVELAPFWARYIIKAYQDKLDAFYALPTSIKLSKFLEDELSKNGTKFFIDDEVSPADIMLYFAFVIGRSRVEGFDSKFPMLTAWLERIEADPVFQATEAKIKQAEKSLPKL